MFIVFNKQKIYSYLVALSTVAILFVIAFAVTNDTNNTLQTSSNIEGSNTIENIKESNNVIIKNAEEENNIIIDK